MLIAAALASAALAAPPGPRGGRGKEGPLLVYYVSGEAGGLGVGKLAGTSIAPIGPIVLDGASEPLGVVDPDAWRLPSGKIRLAYLSGFPRGPRAPPRPLPAA